MLPGGRMPTGWLPHVRVHVQRNDPRGVCQGAPAFIPCHVRVAGGRQSMAKCLTVSFVPLAFVVPFARAALDVPRDAQVCWCHLACRRLQASRNYRIYGCYLRQFAYLSLLIVVL